MSLTTDIAALTSQVTDLTDRVAGWVSDADARIAAAIAAVPELKRTLYVDPANGDDNADGRTTATPLATISRALELAAPIMWTEIVVMGDIAWSGVRQMYGNSVYIRSDDPAARRRVDIGTDAGVISWNTFLRFQDLHLVLPAGATNAQKIIWPAGFTSVVFRDCTVEYQGTGDVYLAARGYGGVSLSGYGITSVNMAGRWLQEAPAGTEIDAVPGVISSIANV